ncbi:helix-turn-helix domain-containing protein [Luteibacter anthropi]|uniref:helix-turn-helix domain-containing protein n=1 Tax=Luteibacter anthropi TaxID=564369 RepID=UPI0020324908|nr:helix-turn-helix domain-containing protein [Luteibacter anthropi]URX61121.1 helix-turn-helix domain-containing protein [Luteibacter anthropi]
MTSFHTVEDAATRLGLHPRTVHRMIREGRLRATRIGKSYRILPADLNAFAGVEPTNVPSMPPRATAIVDVPDTDPATADRLTVAMQGMWISRGSDREAMQFTATYDAPWRQLRFVAVGAPAEVAAWTESVAHLLEGLQ